MAVLGLGDMRKVKALVEKTENLRRRIYQRLPSDGPEVEGFAVCAQLAQHTEVKKCQQTKLIEFWHKMQRIRIVGTQRMVISHLKSCLDG